jgi:hypothetical protein
MTWQRLQSEVHGSETSSKTRSLVPAQRMRCDQSRAKSLLALLYKQVITRKASNQQPYQLHYYRIGAAKQLHCCYCGATNHRQYSLGTSFILVLSLSLILFSSFFYPCPRTNVIDSCSPPTGHHQPPEFNTVPHG